MELEVTSRRPPLVRMVDQDRVSQASSVATISYIPVRMERDGKVQNFGKRCQAAKRDPNCPVVIRGWLNKKDSSGLKLWKRRWFVLSNYCLYYYKDSREESVLGSIPLPSYKILFCTPQECKNRKFTFKVVHQGMRSYFLSADTQEDMLGWVRALSQSAVMEPENILSRRCSSYQDFTQIGGSSESVDFPKPLSDGEGPSQRSRHVTRTLSEPSHLTGGRMGMSHSEQRGRRRERQRNSSPSGRTPSPSDASRRRACGPNHEEDFLTYNSGLNTPPTPTEIIVAGPLTSRGQLGSRPHTPVGRVDIRPHDDHGMAPPSLFYCPSSPKLEFKSTPNTPVTERWQNMSKPTPSYGSVHHMSGGRRPLAKSYSTGAQADLLPPLPPSSRAAHASHPPQHHHHHHHHHRSHLSVCVLPSAMTPKSEPRDPPAFRPLESDADAVLTRLCGCDKLMQTLSLELGQLQMDKDSVHCALEVTRLQLDEWAHQGPRAHEEVLTQKALLQEELVTIRARMCDVSMEMERVWSQYERMESELSVIRSHLQHICNFGMPQDQSQAQRDLWMMEDILSGLKVNRDHFRFLMGLHRPHPGSPGSPIEQLHGGPSMNDESPPARPPLPQELQESNNRNHDPRWPESPQEGVHSQSEHRGGNSQPDLLNVKVQKDKRESQSCSKWSTSDTTTQSTKKTRMGEEEQLERMKKNQERLSKMKKPPIPSHGQALSQSSETREETPFPLRVTRVVTAVLPTSLVARRVSVEDPPPELDTPLPEQIPPEMQQRLADQSKKNKSTRRLMLQTTAQNKPSIEVNQDVQRLSRHQQPVSPRSPVAEEQERNEDEKDKLEDGPASLLTSDIKTDLCLTPEQREAKLKRVERIRQRVIQSAARESATSHSQIPVREKPQNRQVSLEASRTEQANTVLPPTGAAQDGAKQDRGVYSEGSKKMFESKAQHQSGRQRAAVAKTKVKRPDSPYHVSSITVYQKDGGKGFTSHQEQEKEVMKRPATPEDDGSLHDEKAKWFLSTSQWQGFIPLHIPGFDRSNEEVNDDHQRSYHDDGNDDGAMSPNVSQSLEKMKENHSLFYKIACDISISDTDITKNDVHPSLSCKAEGGEELSITEPSDKEDNFSAQGLSNDVSNSSASSTEQAGVLQNPRDTSKPACRSEGEEADSDKSDDGVNTRKDVGKKSDKKNEELDRNGTISSVGLHDTMKQEEDDNHNFIPSSGSQQEGGGVKRSASFGRPRLTVLRTSL
ncbi:pleckstrin homology domain-containing family A member 6 isoform X3 [Synchiropus splendidus]|uniref:pleckstrin homology domain-containing family A member 6 isoform X3 n=1 Tax=Synchiropus splendidus TaxID=270530 RepID=UPI00237E07E1|nr:pleckstrin homology domain-containing family A member 6 isoform X3 [Synchiropus splendidus]